MNRRLNSRRSFDCADQKPTPPDPAPLPPGLAVPLCTNTVPAAAPLAPTTRPCPESRGSGAGPRARAAAASLPCPPGQPEPSATPGPGQGAQTARQPPRLASRLNSCTSSELRASLPSSCPPSTQLGPSSASSPGRRPPQPPLRHACSWSTTRGCLAAAAAAYLHRLAAAGRAGCKAAAWAGSGRRAARRRLPTSCREESGAEPLTGAGPG